MNLRANPIRSKGLISTNMDFINLVIRNEKADMKSCSNEIISLLKTNQNKLKPIFTEIQQRLIRFTNEFIQNRDFIDGLIKTKNDLINEGIIDKLLTEKRFYYKEEELKNVKLNLNPHQFSYDYALQLISIGHFFDINFVEKVEVYIKNGKELNIWKDVEKQWAISRGIVNPGNTKCYFESLEKAKNSCEDLILDIKEISKKYEL